MRGLKDKRVLITGGASGIGAATATRFLDEGSRVCILDRDAKACAAIRHQLPGICEAIIADVTDLMQVEAAMADAIRWLRTRPEVKRMITQASARFSPRCRSLA